MGVLPSHVTSVALVANGAMKDLGIAAELRHFPYIIAVDGGLHHCHALQIKPDLLVGDLDSVSEGLLFEYADVPVHRLPTAKNETDLEVALALVDMPQVTKLVIFCALERRTDHCIANLQLLRRYPGRLQIRSESEQIFCVKGNIRMATTPGKRLSLMSLGGPVRGVSSTGLHWELNNATFDANFFSLSNEARGDWVDLSIPEGDLICINFI